MALLRIMEFEHRKWSMCVSLYVGPEFVREMFPKGIFEAVTLKYSTA